MLSLRDRRGSQELEIFGYAGLRFRLERDLGFINLLAIINAKGRNGTTSQHVWMEGKEKGAGMRAGGPQHLKVGKTAEGFQKRA